MKKMMERKRGLGSKHGNNKRESSNTSSMMKHNSHNAVQDDGEEDSSILSDEEAEVQKEEVIVEEVEEEEEEVVEEEEEEEEEEEQGGEGTKMWDAMNRILGKSLKEEFNEKPVLALRKTKAMKEMDDVSESVVDGGKSVVSGKGVLLLRRERDKARGTIILTSPPQ